MYGSADQDPYQNVTDPQHCSVVSFLPGGGSGSKLFSESGSGSGSKTQVCLYKKDEKIYMENNLMFCFDRQNALTLMKDFKAPEKEKALIPSKRTSSFWKKEKISSMADQKTSGVRFFPYLRCCVQCWVCARRPGPWGSVEDAHHEHHEHFHRPEVNSSLLLVFFILC